MSTRYTSVRGLVDALVDGSGKSRSKVSQEIGRNAYFLSKTVNRGSVPNVGLVNEVAHACGYEMVFRSDAEEVVVTPPELDEGPIG